MTNNKILNESNHATIHLLQHATFKLKTLAEAKYLANYIASACNNANLVALGISEILINAIEHGNLNISYHQKDKLQKDVTWLKTIERLLNLPENSNKFVTVEFKRNSDNIVLIITDQGNGFDWKKYQDLSHHKHLNSSHGRGIVMAKNLAFKEIFFNELGNQVTCILSQDNHDPLE